MTERILASQLVDRLLETLNIRDGRDFEISVCDHRTGEILPVVSISQCPEGNIKLGVRPSA